MTLMKCLTLFRSKCRPLIMHLCTLSNRKFSSRKNCTVINSKRVSHLQLKGSIRMYATYGQRSIYTEQMTTKYNMYNYIAYPIL